MEGITVAPARLKSLVIRNAVPKSRSEQEVIGYRNALMLHTPLYRYMLQAGECWKATNNDIIERNPDGTFWAAHPDGCSTPDTIAMADLTSCYVTVLDQCLTDSLVPLTILGFLYIHTFSDSGGLMSRLSTLLLLYYFDYVVGRYISLERIFEETKEAYFGVSTGYSAAGFVGMKAEELIGPSGKRRGAK